MEFLLFSYERLYTAPVGIWYIILIDVHILVLHSRLVHCNLKEIQVILQELNFRKTSMFLYILVSSLVSHTNKWVDECLEFIYDNSIIEQKWVHRKLQ